MSQPFHEPSWARALNKYTAKLYVASIKYLDIWKPSFLCWFFPPPNSVIAAALLNLSPEYSYAHIHFLDHIQHQKGQFSNSNMYVYKHSPGALADDAQGKCLPTVQRWLLSEDVPLQEQAMLLKEPSQYHETAYHKITFLLNMHPQHKPTLSSIPSQEMLNFPCELPVLKDDFTFKSIPTATLQQPWHPASCIRVHCCHLQQVPWETSGARHTRLVPVQEMLSMCLCVSSCLPESAVPVLLELLAPLPLHFLGSTALLPVTLLLDEKSTWNEVAKTRANSNK